MTVSSDWWQVPGLAYESEGLDVVGEASYQAAIQAAFDRRGHRLVIAELVAEPDNPHDKNAIKVTIDGETVAYIAKRDNEQTLRTFEFNKVSLPVAARAKLIGGGGGGRKWGVVLLAHTWPWDPGRGFLYGRRRLTVKPGKENTEAIRAYLPPGTDRFATLQNLADGKVGVIVDGYSMGTLTASIGAEYARLIQACLAMGVEPTCRVQVVEKDGKQATVVYLVQDDLDLWGELADEALSRGADSAAGPAGWRPDPHGRHEYRYWNGEAWTEHVSDAGEASTDPI